MDTLTKRTDVKLASYEKDYLKWILKPSYMPKKTFDNDLVVIQKNKVTS